ncbi:RDD family protein [Corynebacterium neomassiliense]|uniref:RDD family protein n=1 Tax=Corynebacterium neomassiliense TaxID=2079482 RepID=UPI00102F9160|nr:RDD family protein [Corynebacterium neomassiliense]
MSYPYPPMPPAGYPVVSPYPGPGARLAAYVIDSLVVGFLGAVVGFFLVRDDVVRWFDEIEAWNPETSPAPEPGMSDLYILSAVTLLIWFAYRIIMETSRGQTLGKMALKMKVVDFDGRTPDFGASFLRNSWYLVNFLAGTVPLLGTLVSFGIYIALGTTISRSPYNQSFADRWGKTYVVSTR